MGSKFDWVSFYLCLSAALIGFLLLVFALADCTDKVTITDDCKTIEIDGPNAGDYHLYLCPEEY